jgi:hypothetical protein
MIISIDRRADGRRDLMTHSLERWQMRVSTILWFIAALGFMLTAPVLSSASLLAVPLIVVIATLLSLPLAWLWRRFVVAGHVRSAWLPTSVALSFLLAIILGAPVWYFASVTQLKPALVPQVTLTDGHKQIVFQGMQHVGAARFYENVVFDLEDALSRGYVLYYEGVSPSTPAIDRWFEQTATHGRDLTAAYRELGELCGLDFQNDYLRVVVQDSLAHPDRHVVADVNTAQLKQEYDRLMRVDPTFAGAMAKKVEAPNTDGLDRIVAWLRHGTAGQRDLAGIICRGFMTRAMTNANDATQRQDLDPLILDYRNRVLAGRLLAEPRQRIYVTYGAKHLPGVFALLKQADPHWRVASVKWLRTIDSPESYAANLPGITGP